MRGLLVVPVLLISGTLVAGSDVRLQIPDTSFESAQKIQATVVNDSASTIFLEPYHPPGAWLQFFDTDKSEWAVVGWIYRCAGVPANRLLAIPPGATAEVPIVWDETCWLSDEERRTSEKAVWMCLDGGKSPPRDSRYRLSIRYSFDEWRVLAPVRVLELTSSEFSIGGP